MKPEDFVPGVIDIEEHPLPDHVKKFLEEEVIYVGKHTADYVKKILQDKYAGEKKPVEEKKNIRALNTRRN